MIKPIEQGDVWEMRCQDCELRVLAKKEGIFPKKPATLNPYPNMHSQEGSSFNQAQYLRGVIASVGSMEQTGFLCFSACFRAERESVAVSQINPISDVNASEHKSDLDKATYPAQA